MGSDRLMVRDVLGGDENALELDGDDACTILWMGSMPLNCTLSNVSFHVSWFQLKEKQQNKTKPGTQGNSIISYINIWQVSAWVSLMSDSWQELTTCLKIFERINKFEQAKQIISQLRDKAAYCRRKHTVTLTEGAHSANTERLLHARHCGFCPVGEGSLIAKQQNQKEKTHKMFCQCP